MILDHVPQRSRFLVVAAAAFDANRLRGRNLNVIDITAVPQGLENSIAEPEGKDVLNRFLAEVVIDAVDL